LENIKCNSREQQVEKYAKLNQTLVVTS